MKINSNKSMINNSCKMIIKQLKFKILINLKIKIKNYQLKTLIINHI